jgi:hypothetical protein
MPLLNNVQNQRRTPALYSDVLAQQPSAGFTGRLFVSEDTFALYRDNGVTWDLIGGPGTGTITGSGTAGKITKFNSASVIGDSLMTQTAGTITVTGDLAATIRVAAPVVAATTAIGLSTAPSNVYMDGLYIDNGLNTFRWNFQQDASNNLTLWQYTGGPATKFYSFATAGLTAPAFIKSGGTAAQFLKADGSIDSSTYLTAAGAVTSIAGTANQIIASVPTGAVTLSLPQSIATSSVVQFGGVGIGAASSMSLFINQTTITNQRSVVGILSNTLNANSFAGFFEINSNVINANPGSNAAIMIINSSNTMNIAASGTHASFSGLRIIQPIIGAGAGTLTEGSTVRIDGEPTGAVTNYALNVSSGKSHFGGNIIGDTIASIGAGAVTTYTLNVAGTTFSNQASSTLNADSFAVLGAETYSGSGTETGQRVIAGGFFELAWTNTATFTASSLSKHGAISATIFKTQAGNFAGIMSALYANAELSGAGNITTLAGYRIFAPKQLAGNPAYTGTVTDFSGILIDDITGGTDIGAQITNKYAIQQLGASDRVYFAGAIEIGNTVTAAIAVASTNKVAVMIGGVQYYLLATT